MGLSPLALYLLAAAEQYAPEDGPWTVQDDLDDLFGVTLRTPKGELLHVRAGQKMGGVKVETLARPKGWPSRELEVGIRSVLHGLYSVGERQLRWQEQQR